MTTEPLMPTGREGAPTALLPSVSPSEYETRVTSLRAQMRSGDLVAVVLAAPEGIYHLLGLDHLGYFALALLIVPRAGPTLLVARDMERHTVRAQVPQAVHVPFTAGRTRRASRRASSTGSCRSAAASTSSAPGIT